MSRKTLPIREICGLALSTVALILSLAVGYTLIVRNGEFELLRINPPSLNYDPSYSQLTTVVGDVKMVFVAGQVERPPGFASDDSDCAHSDWRSQYISTMDNVTRALEAGGAGWSDVVMVRKFTTDMDQFLAISDMPGYWDPNDAPSSTLVEVARLARPCQLVEVDVIAAVPAK